MPGGLQPPAREANGTARGEPGLFNVRRIHRDDSLGLAGALRLSSCGNCSTSERPS
jgi:hypothetical protein